MSWPRCPKQNSSAPSSDKLLLLPRYGFGEAGKPKYGIQANAELVYEVTLKSFEKVRGVCGPTQMTGTPVPGQRPPFGLGVRPPMGPTLAEMSPRSRCSEVVLPS